MFLRMLPGGPEGLHSLRGEVRIEWEGCVSPARACGAVRCAAACGGRALLVCGALLAHGGLLALGSALRRAPSLRPTFSLTRVRLPDVITPHILKVRGPFTLFISPYVVLQNNV